MPAWITALIVPFVVLNVVIGLVTYVTLLERKFAARMQSRIGPYRVGPHGLLQPIADALKLMMKEDVVPTAADKTVYNLAPIVFLIPCMLIFATIPFAPGLGVADLNIGILFFLAANRVLPNVLSCLLVVPLAQFLAGWTPWRGVAEALQRQRTFPGYGFRPGFRLDRRGALALGGLFALKVVALAVMPVDWQARAVFVYPILGYCARTFAFLMGPVKAAAPQAASELLLRRLPELGFTFAAPMDGAFYAFCDVSKLTNDSMAFARRMLTEARVAATPGRDFDPLAGHRYMRFSYAGSHEDMETAMQRLARWLA